MTRGQFRRALRAALITLFVVGAAALLLAWWTGRAPFGPASPDAARWIGLAVLAVLAAVLSVPISLAAQRSQARAQAEQLRELERELRRLQLQVDQTEGVAGIGSWEWELEGGQVVWSDEMFRILGVERGSFQPSLEGYLRRVPAEDRESVRQAIRQAESGEAFELEHRLLRPDGEVRTVIERGGREAEPAREPVRVVGTTQDVTDRRSLEERLQMRREIYMSLLEAQSDLGQGAIMTEGDRILYFNPALQRLLAQQPAGRGSLPDWLAAIDAAGDSALRREFELRRERALPPGQGEARLIRADGTSMDLEFVIDSIRLGERLRTVALVRDVSDRKAADAELRRSREQLRRFSLELTRVREEEGTRISREIHDELGQRLTGLKLDLAWVAARLRRPDADRDLPAVAEKIGEMTSLADDTIEQVRRIATELRPGVLDDLGFVAALEWQCQEFSRRSGVPCQVAAPADVAMSDDVSTALFRILQEALTNISRHAQASNVDVRLSSDDSFLVLEVEDNGQGLSSRPGDGSTLGLLGIAERARLVGGVAFIGPTPEGGTIVLVRVPRAPSDSGKVAA